MFPRDARKITDIFTPDLESRFAQGSLIAVRKESWSKTSEGTVDNRFTYDTPDRMLDNIEFERKEKQCWHEVIFDGPQKIRFDIDIDRAKWEKDKFQWKDVSDYGPRVAKHIVKVFMDEFWIRLKGENFVFCESSNDQKYSMHIIVTGFYVENAKEAEWFCQQVCKRLQDENKDFPLQFIDQSIYGSVKSLRIAGFSKLGQNRVKKIIGGRSVQDSLIKWVKDCRKLERKTKDVVPSSEGFQTIECSDPRFRTILDRVGEEFTFTHTKGSMMYFSRTKPTFCQCCGREHDKEGGYVFVMGNNVYWKCWRAPKGSHTKLFGFEKTKYGGEKLDLTPCDPRLSLFDRMIEALDEFYHSDRGCDSALTMYDHLTINQDRKTAEKDFYDNISEYREYCRIKGIQGVFDY